MKVSAIILIFFVLFACNKASQITSSQDTVEQKEKKEKIQLSTVISEDGLSVRAIDIDQNGQLVYVGNNGRYGFYDPEFDIDMHEQISDSLGAEREFRGVSFKNIGANFISAGNPALIYSVSYIDFMPKLVYQEKGAEVFYDAMNFWNDEEGIAFGDAVDGCMSVLITRNAGQTWDKLNCSSFFEAEEGAGAFAASDTNIEIVGDHTWLASKDKIFYSPDKGENWEVYDTPIINEKDTQGIYSIDFFNEYLGVAIGGDFTEPDSNKNNLLLTNDGGKTWEVISSETSPGYRSCIQFIPGSSGQGIIAVGFNGIDVSRDSGQTWNHISDESFYTVRFLDNNEGYMAGKDRIVKFQLF